MSKLFFLMILKTVFSSDRSQINRNLIPTIIPTIIWVETSESNFIPRKFSYIL